MSKLIQWRQITPTTESPSPRFGHTVSRLDKSWVMFGGICKNERTQQFEAGNELY